MSNNVKLFFKQDSSMLPQLMRFVEEGLANWNTFRANSTGKAHTISIKEDSSNGIVYGFENVKHIDISINQEPTQALTLCHNFDDMPEAGLKAGEGMVAMISDYNRGRQILMALQHQAGFSKNSLFNNSIILDVNDEVVDLDLGIVLGKY